MTFIPNVLTDTDVNNSINTTDSSFTGTVKLTTGYNTIILTIESDQPSAAGGIQIQFSDTTSGLTTYYTDTYLGTGIYSRSFKILKKYYRIIFTSSINATFTITSRLSTQLDSSITGNDSFYYATDDGIMDAFGKLRVSNPYTTLDLKFPGQATGTSQFLSNNIIETNTGTGSFTGTYQNAKCIISGTGLGKYINQSRKVGIYQPGKSSLFMGSGIIYSGPTGADDYTGRIGYYDDNNGLYFGYDSNSGIFVAVKKNGTSTKIYKNNWNIDKMDGTGISSISLDFTKTQLYVIDFEWLGVGRIRFGFYAYGKIYYCHQVTNINLITEPYMTSPNLPIRYELEGTNAGQATPASLTEICATMISEGGYNPVGRPFSASNGDTTVALNTTTETLLLAIRINSLYNNVAIIPTSVSVIADTQNIILYRVRLYLDNASPGTISYTPVDNNSVMEYGTTLSSGTLSTTNSIVIDQGYFAGKQTTNFSGLNNIFTNLVQVTKNVSGVSDILVLTCEKITGGNTNAYGSINWQESY